MSEKTKEVPRLADATYARTLVIKSTHEFIDSFTMQTLSIHCILKFLDLFGFLRHYLSIAEQGFNYKYLTTDIEPYRKQRDSFRTTEKYTVCYCAVFMDLIC